MAAGKAREDVELLTPSRMQSPEFASKLAHFRSSPGLGSTKVSCSCGLLGAFMLCCLWALEECNKVLTGL